MKKLTLVGLFVGTLAVGAIAGAWVGAWWSGRAFARMAFAKPEVEHAFLAAQEANWAALLRLNESKSTIADLENSVLIRLSSIAAWDSVAPADEQTRMARDRFLTTVKVYSQSFPFTGTDAARIDALLATIPGRSPTSTCKNGVCRLDDLRLAKAHSSTNSP